MDNMKDINELELQQEERIMTFLQGKMSSEDEMAFLKELDKDEEFKAKAISIARLAKGINQVGKEKDEILKEALLSVDKDTIRAIARNATDNMAMENAACVSAKEQTKAKKTLFRRKYITILSAAASILFIVYFGFLYNDYSKTLALGEQYATAYETSAMRGEEQPEVTEELEKLINNVYSNNDLGATLKRLAVLWEVSTMESYNDYTNHAPEIGWALATGYLKDNNRDDARVVLEKMAKLYEADDAMGKKVRELLDKLSKL
jgi:hypothetical protein